MSSVELIGTGWLTNKLAYSSCIKPHFKEDDRNEIFDGNIFVYKKRVCCDDFLGSIPVQIKSRTVKNHHKDTTTFSYIKSHLQAFYQENGVILFILENDSKKHTKAFIKVLRPIDLKIILSSLGSKKSISVSHKFIDLDDLPKLENECKNFLIQRDLQSSTKEYSLTPEQAKIIFFRFDPGEFDPITYLSQNPEQIIYGMKSEQDPPIFLDLATLDSIKKKIIGDIFIGDKKYYSEYVVENLMTSKSLLFIGNSLKIDINSNKLHFKLNGTFMEKLHDLEFFLDAIEKSEIIINGGKFILKSTIPIQEIEAYKKIYRLLSDTKALFDFFAIDCTKLIIEEIDKESSNNLKLLIDILIYHKEIILDQIESGIKILKIGNLHVLVAINKKSSGILKISNFFGEINGTFVIADCKDDTKKFPSSRFVVLHSNDLLIADNLSLINIEKDIFKIAYSDYYGTYLNDFGLEVLLAFDKSKNEDFLTLAQKIFLFLIEMYD